VRFVLTPGLSKATYRGHEQLRALTIPSEAVGTTEDVTGSLVLEERGTIRQADSRITVDLRSLRSDQSIRDNYIQENTLHTSQFPTAEFQPTELRGVPNPIPLGREVQIELVGDLTVHGTTRPVTWTGSARLDGDTLTGAMSTHVTITEFGMELPRVFLVLSLEDALTLEITFQARSERLPRP
jgi:polyisoprenoid-binding protein YceI